MDWVYVTASNVGSVLVEMAKMFNGVCDGYEHESSPDELLAREIMLIGAAKPGHFCALLMDAHGEAQGIATGDVYADPAGRSGIRLHWTYSKVRDGRDRLYAMLRGHGLGHVTIETARPDKVMKRYDPELTEVARIYRRDL